MAKVSSVQKNKKREKMSANKLETRQALKKVVMDRSASLEDRMKANMRLAKMPRNSSRTRVRNRCEISGRARGFYRKFKISRIALREMGGMGLIPGVTKASW